MNLTLTVKLLSDTTFGRGDGVTGLVDEEIEHDLATGLPIIRGRTLKGLLVEECANILHALHSHPDLEAFNKTAAWLFGSSGSTLADGAHMRVGQGELPYDLQQQVQTSRWSPSDILGSLTTIRRQTAVDEETGVPADRSLRASRVTLRGLTFRAALDFDQEPEADHLALLAACTASVRRAGSGRNRGRGRVEIRIEGPDFDFDENLEHFAALARGQA
ncbi:MAG: hypothetical protein OHK0023_18180 [Anaerolineae bacterium]